MKTFILSAMLMLVSNSAFSGCIEDFRFLQNKTEVKLKFMREIEIKSAKDLKKLREAELKAVTNYIKYMNFKFVDDYTLTVTNEQYQEKRTDSSVGYRISVTDGGDESTVRYYIKIDVGMEDVAYPILYRVFDNQSPERDFLCEKY